MEPISIRLLGLDDDEALLELLVRNRTFLAPWEPRRPDGYLTLEWQREALARVAAEADEGRAFPFGIFTGGELVGRVSLDGIMRKAFQNALLGYFVDERANGRGYATAAVGLAVRFAFEEAGLHRVQAAVMPRNVGSIRVLERNGFREEGLALRYLCIAGVWEDHRIFALTREEGPPWGALPSLP